MAIQKGQCTTSAEHCRWLAREPNARRDARSTALGYDRFKPRAITIQPGHREPRDLGRVIPSPETHRVAEVGVAFGTGHIQGGSWARPASEGSFATRVTALRGNRGRLRTDPLGVDVQPDRLGNLGAEMARQPREPASSCRPSRPRPARSSSWPSSKWPTSCKSAATISGSEAPSRWACSAACRRARSARRPRR